MIRAMPTSSAKISSFDFKPGRVIGGKYVIDDKLGAGWEGEVYRVVETRTGIHRAAKLFFPQRNVGDRAVKFYAKKLERLRNCPIVIQYMHSETLRYRGVPITCLVSELVEGELLSSFIRRQRGRRLQAFEALHLVYALACGMECIHNVKEYHGDLHDENVLVSRRGIFFDVKILDFFQWGAPTTAHFRDDVADLVRILYDSVGGRARYAGQPPQIKAICRGLRRGLIGKAFPTARQLREYLESFSWDI